MPSENTQQMGRISEEGIMDTWKCRDGESTQVSQGPMEEAPSACAVLCRWGTSPPGGPQDCV